MAYNPDLAGRIRSHLVNEEGISERKMFGGLSFMLHGNMVCGVLGEDLIVRVGPEMTEQTLGEPYTRAFDFTGRPMRGWVVVEPAGFAGQEKLLDWLKRDFTFATSLLPKDVTSGG